MKSFRKSILYAWLLYLPQLLLTLLLLYGVLIGMVQSFGIIPSLGLSELTLDYYHELLAKPQLNQSIFFSLRIAGISSIISIVVGLFWAYLWLTQDRLADWQRLIVRIPILVPHLVVALFVLQLFSKTGLFARFFFALGFQDAQKWFSPILFRPNAYGTILAYLWKEIPFVLFYCFPMIQTISDHLGQAARTLGASPFQTYLKITLPLAKNTIMGAFVIIFMFSFGAYELPALLGPTLPKALPIAAYEAYSHPDLMNRPFAMAYNGTLLIIGLLCAGLIVLILNAGSIRSWLMMILQKGD